MESEVPVLNHIHYLPLFLTLSPSFSAGLKLYLFMSSNFVQRLKFSRNEKHLEESIKHREEGYFLESMFSICC